LSAKLLKKALVVRGDSYYCPLAFSLDIYGNCLTDCYHCFFRRLNYVWGQDLKPIDLVLFKKTILNGLKNKNPRSFISAAIHQKKTLRIGNKADPYQNVEKDYCLMRNVLRFLKRLNWEVVIQTRFTGLLVERDVDILSGMNCIVLVEMSPGYDEDWKVFERKRTTKPSKRIEDMKYLMKNNIQVGVNGEPFIPGYHTVKDFENTIKILKSNGLKSYSTYNFHWNDYIVKRLYKIGIDIEKIWYYNRDEKWKPILSRLIEISKKYGIDLGCPDFVNSGNYCSNANTCCGIDVQNPCTFNAITWKSMLKEGKSPKNILKETFDGVGDWNTGFEIMFGKSKKLFTMRDIKW